MWETTLFTIVMYILFRRLQAGVWASHSNKSLRSADSGTFLIVHEKSVYYINYITSNVVSQMCGLIGHCCIIVRIMYCSLMLRYIWYLNYWSIKKNISRKYSNWSLVRWSIDRGFIILSVTGITFILPLIHSFLVLSNRFEYFLEIFFFFILYFFYSYCDLCL